jgi:FkbH-like protein
VGRILKAWNIAADTVVFVDDSPMEVAEVQAAYPQMECLVFPRQDPQKFWAFLERLRDIFGKAAVQAEDALRLDSIRAARQAVAEADVSADEFLAAAEAVVEFAAGAQPDERAFELINKTNQFNLNGRRWDAGEWSRYLAQPEAVLVTASYRDRYGPLGKIAALAARRSGPKIEVDAWVMSCRAFSRRIEHQFVRYLFDRMEADEIVFDFAATPRNGPARDFFRAWTGVEPDGRLTLRREEFESACPALFHKVDEAAHV